MDTVNKHRNYLWFPTLLIVWNLIDIAVHVATNLIEPLRVAGNIVGLVAALLVAFGVAKRYTPHILGGAAILVIVFNAIHSVLSGWLAPSFLFIGVSLLLLLLWA